MFLCACFSVKLLVDHSKSVLEVPYRVIGCERASRQDAPSFWPDSDTENGPSLDSTAHNLEVRVDRPSAVTNRKKNACSFLLGRRRRGGQTSVEQLVWVGIMSVNTRFYARAVVVSSCVFVDFFLYVKASSGHCFVKTP